MIKASILLLHYNKNYEISLILEAFCKQSISSDLFEIIIIDDGSDNPIYNEIDYYTNKGLKINLIELIHTGNRAANRNKAVEKSMGDIIIFLDSDMIPNSCFIEKHINNVNSGERVVSLGYRHLLYDFPHEYITIEVIKNRFDIIENMPCSLDERESFLYAHNKLGISTTSAWYMGYSHNIALKKSLYLSVEGFDSNFQFGWGVEDVELSFQLYKAGASFIYDGSILLYHVFHKNSFNIELYSKNLNYFYNKYKSYESELFMTQHFQNPISMCKLYDDIKKGKHLSIISKDIIKKCKNTLFIGFTNTDNSINDNHNKLISTNDKNAEYSLIGSVLPYNSNVFDKVIVSEKYNIISNEFLFVIIQELLRVGKKVYIQQNEKLEEINFIWRKQTGFTFDEFINTKKIRVLITPSSKKRQNNVLFTEFAKALSKHGFYVSLELASDELKDNYDIYPLNKQDCIINSMYSKEFRFFSDLKITFMDNNSKNFINMNNVFHVWWGDIPLYGQNCDLINNNKPDFELMVTRDKKSLCYLVPGIKSVEINKYLCGKKRNNQEGILIIDLYLDNLAYIKEIINRAKGCCEYVPITIITLPPRLDENKIYKNSKFRVLSFMNNKQIEYIKRIQNTYENRLNDLIDYCFCMDNISIYNSTGDLDEIDQFIKKNSDFFDLSTLREFNPYVLESAAFGLRVYTTSDLYEQYDYTNIYQIDYEKRNSILDTDIYLDRNWIIKPDVLFYKRMILVDKMFEKYLNNRLCSIDEKTIIRKNKKYDWSVTIDDFFKHFVNL